MTGGSRPRRLVLLGHPVAHSLSPLFQGAALRAAGIDVRYEPLDVAPHELEKVLADLVAAGAAGNVTIPHKRAVWAACARRTAVAARAGAVNTFWVHEGTLHGDNTDVAGFDRAARALGVATTGARVVLLGAGGAAAAVCVATESWDGARVCIVARRPEQAHHLAAVFSHVEVTETADALADCSLLVNATPVGMRDDVMPCDPSRIPPDAAVMDLVYRRGETAWVRAARATGHVAADGREMLLQQGALAFERWFGMPPDIDIMRAALDGAR